MYMIFLSGLLAVSLKIHQPHLTLAFGKSPNQGVQKEGESAITDRSLRPYVAALLA